MSGDVDLKQLHAQITGQPYQDSLWGVQTREIGKDLGPVSHTHDPETSKAVERSITDSGKRKSHNRDIAWLVARHPGKTASELTKFAIVYKCDYGMGEDRLLIEVRRRLSDMNGIHVRRGEKHEARMGLLNNKESIWWPK